MWIFPHYCEQYREPEDPWGAAPNKGGNPYNHKQENHHTKTILYKISDFFLENLEQWEWIETGHMLILYWLDAMYNVWQGILLRYPIYTYDKYGDWYMYTSIFAYMHNRKCGKVFKYKRIFVRVYALVHFIYAW